MTSKKTQSSKKQKNTIKDIVLVGAVAVAMYIYTSFIWLLIAGGTAVAIVSLFVGDGLLGQKLMTSAICLAVAAVGLLLARLLDKNILNTVPTITF